MTDLTRQEIIDAHEALEKLCQRLPATRAAKETILRALPPLPRLTMAEIAWDSDKHYLAEAEHPASGKVIMVDTVFYTEDAYIYALVTDEDETYGCLESPSNLTPTGRRYTLTEVQE